MELDSTLPADNRIYIVTQVMMVFALFFVLYCNLLPALLAGFLVYQLIDVGARLAQNTRRLLIFILISLVVVAIITLGLSDVTPQAKRGIDSPENLGILMQKIADVVDKGRSYLPYVVQNYLPADIEEWQVAVAKWLRDNASHLGNIGQSVGVFVIHVVIGTIIGGLVALNPAFPRASSPLSLGLSKRIAFFRNAFRRVVFSQIRISALNTFLTAIFLLVILPWLGSPLPLTKVMITLTFVVGLLPIVGNLISNTVIFLIALSVSPLAAIGSLMFLIVLHKLEYFVNAHIVGTQIRARAWELLIAMLVMESAFGIAGLVAAPIYYAYIKDELMVQKLI